jgi:RNA recognition motif-containing protein
MKLFDWCQGCELFLHNDLSRISGPRRCVQIVVHGIPFAYNNFTLRDMFAEFGTLLNVHVFKDELGRGKGYGLLCFSTPEVCVPCPLS